MKKNILYLSLIISLLVIIALLVFIIVELTEKTPTQIPQGMASSEITPLSTQETEGVEEPPEYIKYNRYGIKPKEARFYESE